MWRCRILKLDESKIRKGKPLGLPYVGSKKKIAKKIVEIIKQNFGTDKTVYDLFGGGGAITFECLLNDIDVVYNDKDKIIINMINRVLNTDRDFLKTLLTDRETFFKIREKENKTTDDYLRLLVNSFGYNSYNYLYSKKDSDIKFKLAKKILEREDVFRGYKQTETFKNKDKIFKSLDRIQFLESISQLERMQVLSVLEKSQRVDKSLKVYNEDYTYFSNIENYILYLDPPYVNTEKRCYRLYKIDYDKFYSWCKTMSKNNVVLISAYNMPDDFECVFEFKKARSTMQRGARNSKYEKLFRVK